MDDYQRDRLGTLLEEALARSAAERPRFLEEACGADAGLREELDSLLAAFESSSGFFEVLAEEIMAPVMLAATPAAATDDVAIGQTVSHYEIVERIGDGGMGVVYKGRDLSLGRSVALKFLAPQLTRDDVARQRLLAEARATSALDHPNIGVVHEIGETEAGGLFIAMSWYDGETLKQKLQRGPLPLPQALALARQIASALVAAHDAGIIHRDVKPSNIVITTNGVARLVDFGIAKVAGVEQTKEGATLGTVAYMSPEQTRGETNDPRTDVWSLGVVLYEMLTGQRPFRGDHDQAVIYAIRNDAPTPIARLRPEVPAAVMGIVETCLAKTASQRYPRAEDLLSDLQSTDEVNSGSRLRRFRLRSVRALAIAGAAIVVGISGYLVSRRSVPSGLVAERVVVAMFENRTGKPDLDPIGSMAADWVVQGLSRTGVVEIVPMTAALTASRFVLSATGEADSAERIRLIATETGAGIVVSGAYYQQRDSLYLRATLTDVGRNRVLHAIDAIATPVDQPLGGIEELRQRLVGVLVSHIDPRMQQHANRPGFNLPSFDAYTAYAEGLERFIARDWQGAIPRFSDATSRDSTFVTSLVLTAMAFINMGNWAAVDSVVDVARPRLHFMHETDRGTFDFLHALVRGDRAGAYRAHSRAAQTMPGGLGHWGLANAALWVNRPREAVQVSRQLDPERGELRGWYFYWRDLGRAHHRLSEYREELRAAQRARTLFPDEPAAVWSELRALAALRQERALNTLLENATIPAWMLRQVGFELLAHGSAAHGELLLRESLVRHQTLRSDGDGYRYFLAQAHALVGNLDEAYRTLRELVAERPEPIDFQGMLGTLAARRGDTAEAARISAWLAGLDRPYTFGRHTYWRARIASVSGDRQGAVLLLRQAILREGLDSWDSLHNDPDFAPLRDFAPFRELMRPKG